jgi:hypothetical protein
MSSLRILSREMSPVMHLKVLTPVVPNRRLVMLVSALVSACVITDLTRNLNILILLLELVHCGLHHVDRQLMAALIDCARTSCSRFPFTFSVIKYSFARRQSPPAVASERSEAEHARTCLQDVKRVLGKRRRRGGGRKTNFITAFVSRAYRACEFVQ